METAARAFFKAWRDGLDRGDIAADALRLEAIGTAYFADREPEPTILPHAASYGLQDLVSEDPRRLGYRDMLLNLLRADGLVVFGSDDPTYTASKLYPYLLAQRPLLALFHRSSSVVTVMRDVGGGRCVTFDEQGFSQDSENQIVSFLRDFAAGDAGVSLNQQRFESYTARDQARRLVQWFADVIAASYTHPPGRS
jgi:hypothetical protein